MWSNDSEKRETDSNKLPWWSNKRAAHFFYVLFFFVIAFGVGRGCLRHRGYEYYPEIIRLSAHLNRGGAKITHKESIMKGTTAWLGNSVESTYSQNEMFGIYCRNLNKDEWVLVYKERDEYIFCRGEINLKIKYRGASVPLKSGTSLFKYSEDFQWPDWGGYCKKH